MIGCPSAEADTRSTRFTVMAYVGIYKLFISGTYSADSEFPKNHKIKKQALESQNTTN